MRDPNRIKPFLDRLGKVWKQLPDLRFGQLIENVFETIHQRQGLDCFYVEDDDMIKTIEAAVQTMMPYSATDSCPMISCPSCRSTFKYADCEGVEYIGDRAVGIVCPTCHRIIWLDSLEWEWRYFDETAEEPSD